MSAPATMAAPTTTTSAGPAPPRRIWGALTGLAIALPLAAIASIAVGSRWIPPADVLTALTGGGSAELDAVVLGLRLPRTALGLVVGAALGVAGALMQAVTRNPLADPGILGVSAGAAFVSVVGAGLFGVSAAVGHVGLALTGALVTAVAVHLLGSAGPGGARPETLALAGVAVTALLGSLTTAVLLLDLATLDKYRFWAVGTLATPDADALLTVLPFLAVGAVLALVAAPALDSLALGEDVARGLGVRVGLTRTQVVAAVTLLAGASVAAAGPIAFVGLAVPHLARLVAGTGTRGVLVVSALLGALMLVAADVVGRLVAHPGEVAAGIVVAAIGAPVFVLLLRRAPAVGL